MQSMLPSSFVVDNIFFPFEYTEKHIKIFIISEFEADEVDALLFFFFDTCKTSKLVPRITTTTNKLIIAL